MATMPLLSQAEVLKFESALLNYSNNGVTAPEWAMYTSDTPPDDLDEGQLPPRREGSEQLAKATKDLISLDCSSIRWNESLDRGTFPANSPHGLQSHSPASYVVPTPLQRFTSPLHHFFGGGAPSHSQRPPPLTAIAPIHTLHSSAVSDTQQTASSVSSDRTPPPQTPPSLKRPYTSSSPDLSSLPAGPSNSNSSSISPSQQQQSKKPRASPPHQQGPVLNTKPTVLTSSQKKANHIQSEQKRRANIRRGYEALCETVPALREAIAAEERELAEGGRVDSASETGSKGLGKSKKKTRGKRAMSESGEKIDGRAGPRSENVILQKTIDYIQELLDERKVLIDRLNKAQCKLAPGHSALVHLPQGTIPLWEREWTGGTGITDDGDSDDEDES